MRQKFRLEDVPDGATRFLVPDGELDAADAHDLRQRVDQALAAGKQRVIFDLTLTTFIETAVIAALLDANARARQFGAVLAVVVEPGSKVQSLFAMSGLHRVLTI